VTTLSDLALVVAIFARIVKAYAAFGATHVADRFVPPGVAQGWLDRRADRPRGCRALLFSIRTGL
jgi:hypothetical protein